MTVTREQFASQLLLDLSKPVSVNNLQSMVAWSSSENTQAENNPYATTLQFEGSSEFNSAGVKNYATLEEGLAATKATLLNGLYGDILSALDRSASPAETCSIVENSPWGSKPSSELVAQVVGNFAEYANHPIGGSAAETAPGTPAPVESGDTANLEIGSHGPAVEELQAFLDMNCNQHLTVDGYFGELTKLAVQNLQRIMHLTVDGIVGPQTRAAISYIQAEHGEG